MAYLTAPSICVGRPRQHQQAEGRDQEHLEPDIEVEDVAGQERAADARHHQHQERVETVALALSVDVARR